MFGLLYGLVQHLRRKVEYNVLILGLDNAGKTTLVERLKPMYSAMRPVPLDKIVPTIGFNCCTLSIGRCVLNCWDLGGQATIRTLWEQYFGESNAVVFVVDSADESRLEEAKRVLGELLHEDELCALPFLVLCNKQDCHGAKSAADVEHFIVGGAPLDRPGVVRWIAISALNGEHVGEGFEWLSGELERTVHAPRRPAPAGTSRS